MRCDAMLVVLLAIVRDSVVTFVVFEGIKLVALPYGAVVDAFSPIWYNALKRAIPKIEPTATDQNSIIMALAYAPTSKQPSWLSQ